MVRTLDTAELREAGIGAFFRPRDLTPLGISHRKLQGLVSRGVAENFGNGLYRLTEVPATELETTAMVAAAVPNSVVCLLTALHIHDIGTQLPHETWIALDRKARKPAHHPTRLRIVRFSGPMLTYGVQHRTALGVSFRITSPARTVVDCFRYRNKFGIDVALEALDDGLRTRAVTVSEIMRAAEACRARTVIVSYLDALLVCHEFNTTAYALRGQRNTSLIQPTRILALNGWGRFQRIGKSPLFTLVMRWRWAKCWMRRESAESHRDRI